MELGEAGRTKRQIQIRSVDYTCHSLRASSEISLYSYVMKRQNLLNDYFQISGHASSKWHKEC